LAVSIFQTACAADFDIRNEAEFKKIFAADAKLTKLAGGMQFTEGPVWVNKEGGYLGFSDIPSDELKKWTATNGVTTFRKPSFNANGNTVDGKGRLISCEHTGRRVSIRREIYPLVRDKKSGEIGHALAFKLDTLVDQYEGKKFNSPNDVV